MQRPHYLERYFFDWELLDVLVGGRSSLDSKYFIGRLKDDSQVNDFLNGYGMDAANPINKAELFGNFQEAIQFIKRYFLKEGNPEGVDLKIPNVIYTITDVNKVFLMATANITKNEEHKLWAEIILKVMHTILHADKDLRANYFSIIQMQVFDRFYRHLYRDAADSLFLGNSEVKFDVPLVDFQTKSTKSRDSIIIKLLHKAENVAEELFDWVGVRFVTEKKIDVLRVLRFLTDNYIVIPHNIKPSRSINNLFDLQQFHQIYFSTIKTAIRENLSEEIFAKKLEEQIGKCKVDPNVNANAKKNSHSLKRYSAVQFTGRQLIQYRNPFYTDFDKILKMAKETPAEKNCELSKMLKNIDTSSVNREIRFFYPFEVQIMDKESYQRSIEGEASHKEYKKAQLKTAMNRVFWALLKLKGINEF